MTRRDNDYIDDLFGCRSASLLSVDDIMEGVVGMLTQYDEIDNTYIVFTSDHGYQLGQFRLATEKEQPYDHHLRVPFLVCGPGIPQASFQFAASMVDVAPTILELAGGSVPAEMDGHSFARQLTHLHSSDQDKILVEYWSIGRRVTDGYLVDLPNNTFVGVRLLNATHNYLYVEFYASNTEVEFRSPIEYELFDVAKDPWQMENLFGTDAMDRELVRELQEYLRRQIGAKERRD